MNKVVDNSTFDNSWFKAGRSKIVLIFWYLINVLFFLNPFISSSLIKTFLLRLFGASVGRGVVIKPRVNIKYPWKLKVGDYVWIGENTWIDNLDEVNIGNNVCISQGAMLLCGNHNYKKSTFDLIIRKIVLEDGVWIGAKSVVCPGVICRSHSILTVGSIATKNLEPYFIYQGNPAIKVKVRNIEKSS